MFRFENEEEHLSGDKENDVTNRTKFIVKYKDDQDLVQMLYQDMTELLPKSSPLHWVVKRGNVQVLEVLLSQVTDLDFGVWAEASPLEGYYILEGACHVLLAQKGKRKTDDSRKIFDQILARCSLYDIMYNSEQALNHYDTKKDYDDYKESIFRSILDGDRNGKGAELRRSVLEGVLKRVVAVASREGMNDHGLLGLYFEYLKYAFEDCVGMDNVLCMQEIVKHLVGNYPTEPVLLDIAEMVSGYGDHESLEMIAVCECIDLSTKTEEGKRCLKAAVDNGRQRCLEILTALGTSKAAPTGGKRKSADNPRPGTSRGSKKGKAASTAAEHHPESGQCALCLDAASAVVFVPCGHVCACAKCGMNDKLKQCPICRVRIANKVKAIFA